MRQLIKLKLDGKYLNLVMVELISLIIMFIGTKEEAMEFLTTLIIRLDT